MNLETATPQTNTTNRFGLTKKDYAGAISTLCTGCGHDSITGHLISALYQSSINPFDLAKMSGIGCSSKTPAYFLNQAHGFNSLHGRMAPVATGAKLANNNLQMLGVSGDGDTASIGMGGFIHLLRRNLPMVYIVENNGVYGLTKGQFSATADLHTTQKSGEKNPFQTVDLCSLAIDVGCGFVARSFSGDGKQLVSLLSAAFHHQGTAVIDVISPCITFANHEGSTKSFNHVKANKQALQELGVVEAQEEIAVDYAEGEQQQVTLSDGTIITLKKIHPQFHDVRDASAAMKVLHESRARGEILTGLFFVNPETPSLPNSLKLSETPLAKLNERDLRPSASDLTEMLKDFR